MKLDYNLKLEQTQKLIITPELKLAITLLQYSMQELQEHIQEELLNNPVLEVIEPRDSGAERESEPEASPAVPAREKPWEIPWEEYFRDSDLETSAYTPAITKDHHANQAAIENCPFCGDTMLEDLLEQLRMLRLSPREFNIAAYLAGNLDHNGYLQGDLNELASMLGVSTKEIENGLMTVHQLEPAGIGCRNLQECLLIQLKRLERRLPLAEEIVEHFLPAAADGRYPYLALKLDCTVSEAEKAVGLIRTLNPKPGSLFGGAGETRYIVPDVFVEKVDNRYVVTGNDYFIPQITISPYYQQLLHHENCDEKLIDFVKSKIEKAYWLMRSIEQRRLTLHKVTQQIVEVQQAFLDSGIKNLKPLTLKEVAQAVGVHESTVSRATSNKYVQTPRGLFPLKFFFSSGVSGAGGAEYSSNSIKTYIKEMVDGEAQEKPLSDQLLMKELKSKGIDISRRTVAKYREELSIPASYKRRRN